MSPDSTAAVRPNYDVMAIREDFPILAREVFGKPLVYLDTGASAQKPRQVIRAMTEVMEETYSNVHRGVHFLSQACTDQFEAARETVARFINAREADEIVWTRGATEALNLVASAWGRANIGPGDRIVISTLEHHSNIVPWQLLRDGTGAELAVIPVDDAGEVDLDAYAGLLDGRTKLVSVTHVSNSIGTVLPIKQMARMAHDKGALFMVDGCQAAPHMAVDVQELDVDFYCFSGHKTYGPTGIGALWGRKALLDAMPPYQGGGEMIAHVTFEKSTFKAPRTSSRPARPPSSRRWGWAPRSTISRRSGAMRSWRMSRTSPNTPASAWPPCRACTSSAMRASGAPSSPSPWSRRIPTISAPSSTGRAWRCAPAITAPFRSWSVSMSARRPGPPSGSTT